MMTRRVDVENTGDNTQVEAIYFVWLKQQMQISEQKRVTSTRLRVPKVAHGWGWVVDALWPGLCSRVAIELFSFHIFVCSIYGTGSLDSYYLKTLKQSMGALDTSLLQISSCLPLHSDFSLSWILIS
jgi:hypothetical protein